MPASHVTTVAVAHEGELSTVGAEGGKALPGLTLGEEASSSGRKFEHVEIAGGYADQKAAVRTEARRHAEAGVAVDIVHAGLEVTWPPPMEVS